MKLCFVLEIEFSVYIKGSMENYWTEKFLKIISTMLFDLPPFPLSMQRPIANKAPNIKARRQNFPVAITYVFFLFNFYLKKDLHLQNSSNLKISQKFSEFIGFLARLREKNFLQVT